MEKSKVTPIFILSISVILFAVIGYYIYYNHQYKINLAPVDYSDVIKSSEKLERLYNQLNTIEVSYKFRETEKNADKYNNIRVMIDGVKRDIDKFNSYENLRFIDKFILFFSVKNVLLIFLEIIIVGWIIFIFFGLKKGWKINRKNRLTGAIMYDSRQDLDTNPELDKYSKSAEKIRREGAYTKNETSQVRSKYKKDTSSNIKNSTDGFSTLKSGLDKINEIVVNQENLSSDEKELETYVENNYEEYEAVKKSQSVEYLNDVKEKMALEKIKQTMDNPKAKIIIDYYRNGMDSQQISEVANLSREEVEFVLRIWNNLMDS